MNIGEAAVASGVSAKMIRHYESLGVLPRPPRSLAGYRRYEVHDVMRLRFVRNARDAGFSTADIKRLVSLWQDRNRPARAVKELVTGHLHAIDERLRALRTVQAALAHLHAHCRGDERPECPILDALASATSETPSRPRARGLARDGRARVRFAEAKPTERQRDRPRREG